MANASTARRRSAKRAVHASSFIADAVELVEDVLDLDETPNYALRLTEALEAISNAQTSEPVEVTYSPVRKPHAARPAAAPKRRAAAPAVEPEPIAEPKRRAAAPVLEAEPIAEPKRRVAAPVVEDESIAEPKRRVAAPVRDAEPAAEIALAEIGEPENAESMEGFDALLPEPVVQATGVRAFIAALDKLPPIRLPIGPPIPWKLGLPILLAALTVMVIVGRPQGQPEPVGVRLPAQETYAVQSESPLFTGTDAPAPIAPVEPPATAGVDFFDLGIKFAAVLGLAYGSLVLLKRIGIGSGATRGNQPLAGVRVVHSMSLAPNRTVHVIRTPNGNSLLVGATPNQVNLIADLGELSDDTAAPVDAANFFDILATKLGK